jgi:hypothetical protein
MHKMIVLALALCTGGTAWAAGKGAQQKASVIAQLNKLVERGNWNARLSGGVNAPTRSFRASDIRRSGMPGIEVGHMIAGTLDTRTNKITISMNAMPK